MCSLHIISPEKSTRLMHKAAWAELSRLHQMHTCPNHKYMTATLVQVCVRNICCYNFVPSFQFFLCHFHKQTSGVFWGKVHYTLYYVFLLFIHISFNHLECIRLCWFYYSFLLKYFDLQYYIDFRCITQWFVIFMHYEMIPMTSLVTICHHKV